MSTDYDETRKRRKTSHAVIPPKPKVEYYDCVCVKCGFGYMLKNLPDSTIYDNNPTPPYKITCPKCLPSVPKHIPSPPPRNVQMCIDEMFGAKK